MMSDMVIEKILSRYDKQQLQKLEDFLFSEINDTNMQDSITFVKSSDPVKKEKFGKKLYRGERYGGIFLKGNHYLISSSNNEVLIIDLLGEDHGVDKKYTRLRIGLSNFIGLIANKEEVIAWIRQNYF